MNIPSHVKRTVPVIGFTEYSNLVQFNATLNGKSHYTNLLNHIYRKASHYDDLDVGNICLYRDDNYRYRVSTSHMVLDAVYQNVRRSEYSRGIVDQMLVAILCTLSERYFLKTDRLGDIAHITVSWGQNCRGYGDAREVYNGYPVLHIIFKRQIEREERMEIRKMYYEGLSQYGFISPWDTEVK